MEEDRSFRKDAIISSPLTIPSPNFWKSVKHAEIPRNAFLAGRFQEKEQYIGKYNSKTDGFSFVGPVIQGKGLICIYGQSKFSYRSYDIFLKNDSVLWKSATETTLPDGALPTVETVHGKGYIGRHEDLGIGMIVYKENKWTYILQNNCITSNFEVLCADNFIFT